MTRFEPRENRKSPLGPRPTVNLKKKGKKQSVTRRGSTAKVEERDEMENEGEEKQSVPVFSEDSSCCPICLGPFLQDSYLDKCFHKFCFNCILRWTKVIAGKHHSPTSVKCPLCKTENSSIIHGFDGSCFQRHYLNQDFEDGLSKLLFSPSYYYYFLYEYYLKLLCPSDCVCSFVLSRAHRYRLQCYYTEKGILDDIFNISQYWKSCKYHQPNCWLQSWLRREIQALTQEEDVDIVVHHIHGVMNAIFTRREQKSHNLLSEKKLEEFNILVANAARPFLAARTDRFLYEVQLFLASGLNIEAYDAVYIQRLGWSSPGVNTQASENESIDRATVIPYLYIFDGDSDGNEQNFQVHLPPSKRAKTGKSLK